jgi:16S rRNA (guanine966-N2)-methyltransferase
MLITAGRLGGRSLVSPEDERVRPTADKVRQAIFNMLAHRDFDVGFTLEGARVVDLFAGTGALAIEALSRGASYALFVDDSAESRALIRTNVEALTLTGVTKIWRRDATNLGPMAAGAGGPFTLAFLDPPYRRDLARRALESLRDGKWLAPHAIAVVETAKDETLTPPRGCALLDDRTYGDTRVATLLFRSPAP